MSRALGEQSGNRSVPFLLAAAGGAFLALAGEPWSVNVAAFLGLGLFAEALERAHRASLGRGAAYAATVGLCFGIVVNGVALFSLVELLTSFGHFPAPLAWLTAALGWSAQAVPYAAAAALTEVCRRRGVPGWLAFPPALAFALTYTPQLFPWRPGATQVDFLVFVQMADLGGEPLLDLCLGFVASGLQSAFRSYRVDADGPRFALENAGRLPAGARLQQLGLALACLLVPCAYGLVRLPAIRAAREAAPALKVGVVQSNVGIQMKHDPSRTEAMLVNLRSMTAQLERQGAELTVWAETAYPYRLLRSRSSQPNDTRRVVGDGVQGPVLIGAVTDGAGDDTPTKYNSAWLVRRDGSLGDRVDKSRLLAFGEYVPLWDYVPALQRRFASRGFEAGENDVIRSEASARAPSDEAKLGILICYEDLFFSLSRKVVQRGAQALVNMTNDAWFGDSNEPVLHDMVARLRAVETRRDLVRAVNTGVSSFTTAAGDLVARTTTFTRASFVADVRLMDTTSPYVAIGDWVSPLCGLALLLGVLRQRFKRAL